MSGRAAPRHARTAAVAALALAALALAAAACGGRRPRDVGGNTNPRSEFSSAARGASTLAVEAGGAPPPVPDAGPTLPAARLLARASARAVAADEANVYFGDEDDDALYGVAKSGGEPVRIALRAPVARALTARDGVIAWIATPGDVVLSLSFQTGVPVPLRSGGIYTSLAARGAELVVGEAVAGGGAVVRLAAESKPARIASTEAPPRAVDADADGVVFTTPTKVLRAGDGAATTIASAAGVGALRVDAAHAYVAITRGASTTIARVPRAGGSLEALAEGARAGTPLALHEGEVFYVCEVRRLCAVPAAGGAVRVLTEDPALESATDLAADPDGVFVATGDARRVLAVPLR